jgi:hypothetical protein
MKTSSLSKSPIAFLKSIYQTNPFPERPVLNILSFALIGFSFGMLVFYLRGNQHAPIGCTVATTLWSLRFRISQLFDKNDSETKA